MGKKITEDVFNALKPIVDNWQTYAPAKRFSQSAQVLSVKLGVSYSTLNRVLQSPDYEYFVKKADRVTAEQRRENRRLKELGFYTDKRYKLKSTTYIGVKIEALTIIDNKIKMIGEKRGRNQAGR